MLLQDSQEAGERLQDATCSHRSEDVEKMENEEKKEGATSVDLNDLKERKYLFEKMEIIQRVLHLHG